MMTSIQNSPAPIDQRQFGLWKAFFFSFFSPRVFVDVVKRWPGLCLGYFLLFLMLVSFPLSARFQWAIYNYYQTHVFEPLADLPPIIIQNGRAEFERFMPYRITNKAGKTVIVVDTTGMTTHINHQRDPDLTWLLTKNAIYFNPPDLSLMSNMKISMAKSAYTSVFDADANGVIDLQPYLTAVWPKLIVYASIFLLYPCVIFGFFCIFALLLSAFAWAVQYYVLAVFRYRMGYRETYRLLTVSLTTVLSLAFLFAACGVLLSEAGRWLYLALFAIYFNVGVLAVRHADRGLVLA